MSRRGKRERTAQSGQHRQPTARSQRRKRLCVHRPCGVDLSKRFPSPLGWRCSMEKSGPYLLGIALSPLRSVTWSGSGVDAVDAKIGRSALALVQEPNTLSMILSRRIRSACTILMRGGKHSVVATRTRPGRLDSLSGIARFPLPTEAQGQGALPTPFRSHLILCRNS